MCLARRDADTQWRSYFSRQALPDCCRVNLIALRTGKEVSNNVYLGLIPPLHIQSAHRYSTRTLWNTASSSQINCAIALLGTVSRLRKCHALFISHQLNLQEGKITNICLLGTLQCFSFKYFDTNRRLEVDHRQ